MGQEKPYAKITGGLGREEEQDRLYGKTWGQTNLSLQYDHVGLTQQD